MAVVPMSCHRALSSTSARPNSEGTKRLENSVLSSGIPKLLLWNKHFEYSMERVSKVCLWMMMSPTTLLHSRMREKGYLYHQEI
jgi:hypothetical protein